MGPLPSGKMAALAMVALALVGAILAWSWLVSRPEPVMVSIPKGASCSEVGRLLAERKVVSSELSFRLAALAARLQGRVRWGVYRLTPGVGAFAIARQLARGAVEHVRVCIPEGYTCSQIAAALETHGVCSAQAFLGKVRDPAFARQTLERAGLPVPSGSGPAGLEGFLFPDTYDFPLASDEAFVASVMVRRFKSQVFDDPAIAAALWRDGGTDRGPRQPRPAATPSTPGDRLLETVILASLVEREARLDSERALVAAVFTNRLARGMLLQSCATVQYALGRSEPNLTYDDLAVESPYNTYLHAGYPPGPICSPGLRSLEAASHPADVAYLYFRLNPDGSHTFSTTFAGHVKAGRQRQNGGQR